LDGMMGSMMATERARRYWDKHAAEYDRQMALFERIFLDDGRAWVCSQATGAVLEIAIGSARNLPFYPPDVHLTGVEFSPGMLDLARQYAQTVGRQVDLRLGDAEALDLPDATFDTVVCTLSLCAIPDERRAVAEMKRVLRPGGRLLLLDHIAASAAWARGIQWVLERITIAAGEEHLLRRPLLTVRAEGFVVELSQRSKLGIVERLVARKPADPVPGVGLETDREHGTMQAARFHASRR
jgi:ubiquinone/menaquinone biosynthesis C-methylase UbiE